MSGERKVRKWREAAEEGLLGRRPPRSLPEPAARAIAASQRSAEVLVCVVQFAAIAFFAVFYAATPKAFPPETPFEPVPWTLAAYALFTALRFRLACAGRLTSPFLGVSVVIDISVLMATIWSFHLQYQAEPSLYLKAPTLLYVFIMIALRALRFEAVYILLAGAAAILGWAALVAYALSASDMPRITRDFADYVTSGAILIGAEIDKLISIAAVTAVLAVAVVRARRLLVTAAAEAHAAGELSRFFPPQVARAIRAAGGLRPGDAARREAAVMMIDLRGFSGLAARLGPTETIALLADYQRLIVPVIRRHDGVVDKYLGDGIMATFGAAEPSERYAADALAALDALVKEADDWREGRLGRGLPAPRIVATVAAGPVLFGVTGEASRLEYTVIGEVVNVASKLERHAKAIEVTALVTREAADLARRQGWRGGEGFGTLRAERVEGLDAPLDLVARGAAVVADPDPR